MAQKKPQKLIIPAGKKEHRFGTQARRQEQKEGGLTLTVLKRALQSLTETELHIAEPSKSFESTLALEALEEPSFMPETTTTHKKSHLSMQDVLERFSLGSSRGLFFDRDYRPTLRQRMSTKYSLLHKETFPPKTIDMSMFTKGVAKWLDKANTAYGKREDNGVYYAPDYLKQHGLNESFLNLNGISHKDYFDWATRGSLFRAKEDVLPSDALSAYFQGPTFGDCGSTLQAAIARSIEEMAGTKAFNQLFNKPLTPFLITPILFDSIKERDDLPKYDVTTGGSAGNPFYFLFDSIKDYDVSDESDISESDVKAGDIVYIEGVKDYPKKHLSGFATGWNLICVGKNEKGAPLYHGFGPGDFEKPLTYKQIQTVLIAGYNQPQLHDTKRLIAQFEKSDSPFDTIKADVATLLADDKKPLDNPIGGIKAIMRFNSDKLKHYINNQTKAWHEQQEFSPVVKKTAGFLRQVNPIAPENLDKDFSDYEIHSPSHENMKEMALKFADAVSEARSHPIGFIMSGMPGIGKTHLSVSVLKKAQSRGQNILYIDESAIRNWYQKHAFEKGGFLSEDEQTQAFDAWLNDVDVVVLDDINSKYGTANQFLKKAITYVLSNNKALIISSNNPVDYLKEALPKYIGYDDVITGQFLHLDKLTGKSMRNDWWQGVDIPVAKASMEFLATVDKGVPAAIVTESTSIDLELIKAQYLVNCSGVKPRIRIGKAPYRNQKVYDMYVEDSASYDVFILKVTNRYEVEQLLELLPKVHDAGQKLLIVTDDEKKLKALIKAELDDYLHRKTKPRLIDRLEHLVLFNDAYRRLQQKAQETLGSESPDCEGKKQMCTPL
jgi:DNA replication protein DnaC